MPNLTATSRLCCAHEAYSRLVDAIGVLTVKLWLWRLLCVAVKGVNMPCY